MNDVVAELKRIVGPRGWTSDPQRLEPHLTEWRGTWRGATEIMVMPASVEEVSAVLRACAASRTPIVPQGGNTGLCGGAIPRPEGGEVLLSLSRLNRIRSVDATDYSLVAEAGCVLAAVQAAAAEAGRFFALSLAAEGSCQIGGNLSTDAGGVNVLRYGTARDQVLGLEVVLAGGEVWNGLRSLRKDTAGYDLKQLFIGSEGTLGIITAATLKLHPPPANRQVALLATAGAQQAVDLFADLRVRLADRMQAFELMSARAVGLVLEHLPQYRLPLDASHPWYVLVDTAAPGGAAAVEEELAATIESGLAVDAVLAKNDTERERLWGLRHAISEAQKKEGASLKHDVSVPVGEVARFIDAAESAVTRRVAGARVVAFGHVGDGNVHFNVSVPRGMPGEEFLARREEVAAAVYDQVARFGGSISAEHGIGVLKRDELARRRDPVEMDLMRALKKTLDPHGLLNPGKVL